MRARMWCVVATWVWWWCWCCARAQALLQPVCPADPRCVARNSVLGEIYYSIDGHELKIKLNNGGYFSMNCWGKVALDHPALPRFDTEIRVNHVKLSDCPPPQHSYAEALRALNVFPVDRLEIYRADSELSSRHLHGLGYLDALAFTNVSLASGAFEATSKLQSLRLDEVNMPPVEQLPASLKMLLLINTGVTQLDRAAFAHFEGLTTLIVRDDHAHLSVEATTPLKTLSLEAKTVLLDVALPDSLETVTVYGWAESAPVPWAACKGMKSLALIGAKAETLPDGWLANCTALRELALERALSLASLAPDALRGAPALEKVALKNCPLVRELPPELLYDAKLLTALDLSNNNLTSLSVGSFAKAKQITNINLSNNKLGRQVIDVLAAVPSLQELRLNNNPHLGDACSGGVNTLHGSSSLQYLKKLSRLYLRNTGAKHICRDWREDMPNLSELDLRDNKIDYITFADVQFNTRVEVEVKLQGNNVTEVMYSRHDYETLLSNPARCRPAARAAVRLSSALECSCHSTWAALAMRACPEHVALQGARCASGAALAAVPLGALACAAPRAACPPPCRCEELLRAAAPERVLRVWCERANLTALPPLAPRADTAWDLRLAHNSIAEPRAQDLPPDVIELDLRHNGIVRADTAAALLRAGRNVTLAGNVLQCACGDEPALERLRALRELAPACDAEPARCDARGRGALLALALAPLLLAAGVLAACLARPAWRARLKALLRGLGWLARAAEADERPYDVFLSFSHLDCELVRGLLARLEGGARPYRVCVHYRDWAPGGWIPAQIAASVRRSRRTVAVVSRHFLGSAWARAEFREAYGAALREAEPRLVVVLLDEPARLPLDAELRRYLAANTYVRWGDPWFWPKLRAALPPPRGRPPAAAEPLMLQLSPRALALEAGAEPLIAGAERDGAVLPRPRDAAATDGTSAEQLMLQLSPRSLAVETGAAA